MRKFSTFTLQKTCEMDEESQLEGDFATQVTKIISQIRLPLHSQKIREVNIISMSIALEIACFTLCFDC